MVLYEFLAKGLYYTYKKSSVLAVKRNGLKKKPWIDLLELFRYIQKK